MPRIHVVGRGRRAAAKGVRHARHRACCSSSCAAVIMGAVYDGGEDRHHRDVRPDARHHRRRRLLHRRRDDADVLHRRLDAEGLDGPRASASAAERKEAKHAAPRVGAQPRAGARELRAENERLAEQLATRQGTTGTTGTSTGTGAGVRRRCRAAGAATHDRDRDGVDDRAEPGDQGEQRSFMDRVTGRHDTTDGSTTTPTTAARGAPGRPGHRPPHRPDVARDVHERPEPRRSERSPTEHDGWPPARARARAGGMSSRLRTRGEPAPRRARSPRTPPSRSRPVALHRRPRPGRPASHGGEPDSSARAPASAARSAAVSARCRTTRARRPGQHRQCGDAAGRGRAEGPDGRRALVAATTRLTGSPVTGRGHADAALGRGHGTPADLTPGTPPAIGPASDARAAPRRRPVHRRGRGCAPPPRAAREPRPLPRPRAPARRGPARVPRYGRRRGSARAAPPHSRRQTHSTVSSARAGRTTASSAVAVPPRSTARRPAVPPAGHAPRPP